MRDLLVKVDAPARDYLFMSYAANTAKDLGLTVKYLFIHPPATFPAGFQGGFDAVTNYSNTDITLELKKARHHFELQIEKLNASDPDLPLLEFFAEAGPAPEIICDYCKSGKVDTVMLNSHPDHSLFSDQSDNIGIIRGVKCPVWIVPEGITYRRFSEILYATDYHPEDINNLKILTRFASRFPASITAVHVSADDDFQEKVKGVGFEDIVKKETGYSMLSVKVLPRIPGEPLVREIHDFALLMDADLIVLLRENRGVVDRLLHGSRSENIARQTKLPVLIYNEERIRN